VIIVHRQFTVSCEITTVCIVFIGGFCIYLFQHFHRSSLGMFRLARDVNVVSPVRDCLKRIRIQVINRVSRSHLPVGQARNKVMLLFKDITSAHTNCFSGQKVEHKAETGISEWTDLLE